METLKQDFPKSARLRSKADIDRVFKTGARFSCRGMALRVAGNSLGESRAVFVPSREFRGSVQRNRARRLAREAWRLSRHEFLAEGRDLAFVLYPEFDTLAECAALMSRLAKRAGLAR